MKATVPAKAVDNEYELFPPGTYVGSIDEAEIQDREGFDGVNLRLTMADIEPGPGTEDPGRSRFTGSIAVEREGISVTDVADFGDDDLPYAIQEAGRLLAGISEAAGLGVRESVLVEFDPAQVLSALESGDLAGETALFEIYNRSFEGDDGEDVDIDGFDRFGRVA